MLDVFGMTTPLGVMSPVHIPRGFTKAVINGDVTDDLGARMAPVLQKLLKPGARVVSHRFLLGDWKPDKTEKVTGADGDEYTLHLWIVKDKKEKK